MATTLIYRMGQSERREVLDFRSLDRKYTLNGVERSFQPTGEVVVSGNSLSNVLWSAPGVALDARQLLGGTDVILFGGTWNDYTKTLNAVEGTITFTREVGGKVELVTVANGQISLNRDLLVFADGSVRTDTVHKALITHGPSATVAQLTAEGDKTATEANDWDHSVTSLAPGALLPDAPGGNIRGSAKAPGVSFALSTAGDAHLLIGSSGVDQVYVTPGATVDARQLLGGEDRIFFTGAWEDYSKTLNSATGTIIFTREIDGKSEHVTVANGQIALTRDLLVFADGAVRSDTARLTLANKGLQATVVDLKAQGELTSTTTQDDWRSDTFTGGVEGLRIEEVTGDDQVRAYEKSTGVTVNGRAEAGSIVALTWGGTQKQVTTDSAGKWGAYFAESEVPADGNYRITATITGNDGNVATSHREVVVDTVGPAAPRIDAVSGDNYITSAERAAGVVVSGSAEPGGMVRVMWRGSGGNDEAQKTVAVDSAGQWSAFYSSSELPESLSGDVGVWACASDKAGNYGNWNNQYSTLESLPASDTMANMVIGA